MAIGVPIMIIMLPIAWYGLTSILYKVNIPENPAVIEHLDELRNELGPISKPEKRIAIIFLSVVALWILRRPLSSMFEIHFLTDPGIVMAAAVLLFIMPSGDKTQSQLMTWHDTERLPWGVLILFGGGLSLASAFSDTGLANWLGESLSILNNLDTFIFIIAATTLVIFLTELTSNLATTAAFLPVMGAMAIQGDINPLLLCVPINASGKLCLYATRRNTS